MNQNRFILIIRRFMSRKAAKGAKMALLNQLRVQLIPNPDHTSEGRNYRIVVQHLLGLMVADLHRRGRPKKNSDEENFYAVQNCNL